MALHEYKCVKAECGHITIKLFFGTEEVTPYERCEKCGAAADKIISASIAIVKGFSADNNYGDARCVKPLDQKRNMERAISEANNLNRGRNPR